jgi:hypothetical protein
LAGLGYRAFTGGAVLTAAQVQGYLQDQAVMKFASATARDAAITAPTEGMVCYLGDSSSMYSYDGGSWCVVPSTSYYALSAPYAVTTPSTAVQNIYALTGSGASLGAGFTYEVEGELRVSIVEGATAITPSMQLTYSGTAASSFIRFHTGWNTNLGFSNSGGTQSNGSVAVNTAVVTGSGSINVTNYYNIAFKGLVRTTTAGTLIPQMSLSSVTGIGTMQTQANSYFKVTPIGSSAMTTAGTWV